MALTLPIGFEVVRGQTATENSGMPKSQPAREALQFDVISIKPTPSSDDKTLIQQPPDGTSFHGAPVRMILQIAFGVEDDRIIGAPSWVNTNHYDIEAKVGPEEAPKLDKLKAGARPESAPAASSSHARGASDAARYTGRSRRRGPQSGRC